MAKEVTNNTKLYRAVREVMGAEWLQRREKFPDRRKDGYRVKLWPAQMTDQQITEVLAIMDHQYNLKVHATTGCSGGRRLPWVAFLVPYSDGQ